MPKKKTDITEYTVQKSKALALLDDSFALTELKILNAVIAKMDNYLSAELSPEERKAKIDSNKISLGYGELEKALGLTSIFKKDLKPRLKKIREPIDLVPDDNEDEIDSIVLFERIRGTRDDIGRWMLEFTLTNSAKDIIFIPEHTHYLHYRLKNIVNLKSKFSYTLYMYLEDNRFKGNTIRTTVPFLKKLFGVEDVKGYGDFKVFNRGVLKVAQKELNEKTDCHFTMTTERPGNRIYYVIFHLEDKKEEPICKPIKEQMSIDDYLDQQDTTPIDLYDGMTDEQVLLKMEHDQTLEVYREQMMPEFKELLSDKCIIACNSVLYPIYGENFRDSLFFNPWDNVMNAFNDILQKIYATGIDTIENINSYVLQAVKNYTNNH